MKAFLRTCCGLFIVLCVAKVCCAGDSIAVAIGGEGLGNIKLGDPLTTVVGKMGKKPSEGKTVTTGKSKEYWLFYKEQGITFVFDAKQALNRIVVTNPGIVLKDSEIRVNSSAKTVRDWGSKVHNVRDPLVKLDGKYEQKLLPEAGAVFMINKETDKIETITIVPSTKK